jgi:hypothetical protein
MMWQTVTIEGPTEVISATGGRTSTWAAVAGLSDVKARVIPVLREEPVDRMTVLEDTYEVHLAGPHPEIDTSMRVLDGSAAYDIRRVATPSPWGPQETLLEAVKVSV